MGSSSLAVHHSAERRRPFPVYRYTAGGEGWLMALGAAEHVTFYRAGLSESGTRGRAESGRERPRLGLSRAEIEEGWIRADQSGRRPTLLSRESRQLMSLWPCLMAVISALMPSRFRWSMVQPARHRILCTKSIVRVSDAISCANREQHGDSREGGGSAACRPVHK